MDPKVFDSNKCNDNSPTVRALEVDLEYPKELQELHSDYYLPPDKTETKRGILYEYQLKIADLYDIPIGNVNTN